MATEARQMRTIMIGLTVAALLAGCGKKAAPLPPPGYEKEAPAPQSDLPVQDETPAPAAQ